MSQASERDELRMLQRKAYGRDGGLTEAEAQRLHGLEQRALTSAVPRVENRAGAAVSADGTVGEPEPDLGADFLESFAPADARETDEREPQSVRTPDPDPDPASEFQPSPDPHPIRTAVTALRRHGGVVAVASALLLAIGLGAGWMLFGQRGDDISLTAEQQQRRLELYDKSDYDEGTVRAIGRDSEGALAWYGTKDDGAQACLVIDVGEESGQQCLPRGEVNDFALTASLTLTASEVADAGADADAQSIDSVGVNAFLMFSTTGEPMVAIQRFEQRSYMWLDQFGEEERPRAEKLMSEYDPMNIYMIGTFRDEPVWLVDRSVDNGMETCLVIDAVDEQAQCLPAELAINGGISTLVFVDDGADGSEAWTIQVAYTVNQTPYLVITRDPAPASVTINGTMTEGDEPPAG